MNEKINIGHAVKRSNFFLTKLFLYHNANPNLVLDDNGTTLLWVSISHVNDVKILKLLLSCKDIDVNKANIFYETPLHCATLWNNKKAVKYLLRHNADRNLKDYLGCTPEIIAENKNFLDILKLLRSK